LNYINLAIKHTETKNVEYCPHSPLCQYMASLSKSKVHFKLSNVFLEQGIATYI